MAVRCQQTGEAFVHLVEDGVDFRNLLRLLVSCLFIFFVGDVDVNTEVAVMSQLSHVLDEWMRFCAIVNVGDGERVFDAFRAVWSRESIGDDIAFALKVSDICRIFRYL